MAYDQIAQSDQDAFSDASNSLPSGSPARVRPFRSISTQFENLGGSLSLEEPRKNNKSNGQLDSMLRSVASTGTSYDIIEHDDYEDKEQTPVKKKPEMVDEDATSLYRPPPPPGGLTRMRTASVGESVSMMHPTPDLQTIQGAYVRNIERLEQSADHLSMGSSLDDEKRAIRAGQHFIPYQAPASPANFSFVGHPSRQVSTTSLSNSVVDINTPAAPTFGQLPSPDAIPSHDPLPDSLRSGVAGKPISPPPQNGSSNDKVAASVPASSGPRDVQTSQAAESEGVQSRQVSQPTSERPETSASNDTYRQATTLFTDFDGVHHNTKRYPPSIRPEPTNRQSRLSQGPLTGEMPNNQQRAQEEGLVYYPAPVPMMLNLPQKLSKMPTAGERERRRLQALSTVPGEMRKSAMWSNENLHAPSSHAIRASRLQPNMPAQLRASAFFDHPAINQDVDIKGSSAVQTLDSILDASAQAPVSAFTDHPFAGQLGGDIYAAEKRQGKGVQGERKKKRRNSLSNMLRTSSGLGLEGRSPTPGTPGTTQKRLTKRNSKLDMSGEDTAGPSRESAFLGSDAGDYPDWPGGIVLKGKNVDGKQEDAEKGEDGEEEEGEQEGSGSEEEEEDVPAYTGPPTTLLAELQMRKTQMKSRTRTAATAFPNGMHSTLLELDAVAQIEQKSRKKKHITLAWEDPDIEQEAADDGDDDVPLGLLVGQKVENGPNRPMGLMEQREMEENEPLSRRRARLRGEDLVQPRPELQRASTMYTLDLPPLTDKVVEEREGESLAQRVQRLKVERNSGLAAEFTQEISSQLGLKEENAPPAPEDETLGQRRKRLREEALKKSRHPSGSTGLGIKARSSMADLLSQNPATWTRQTSNGYPNGYQNGFSQEPMFPGNNLQSDGRFSYMPAMQPSHTYTLPGMMPSYPSFNAGMAPMPPMSTMGPMGPMNNLGGFNYNPMMFNTGMGMSSGGWNGNNYGQDPGMMGAPLDPRQRDLIDRWRQGVGP